MFYMNAVVYCLNDGGALGEMGSSLKTENASCFWVGGVGNQRSALRSQRVENTHTHTQTGRRQCLCLTRRADVCRLVPAVPYLAPVVRWAASARNDTQPLALHTLICPISTTIITSASCDSADLCPVWPGCVFVCSGQGRVYHLEECTVFGDVKSSLLWSGVAQTRSVLLDGPEIPLCAPRGKTEGFQRAFILVRLESERLRVSEAP